MKNIIKINDMVEFIFNEQETTLLTILNGRIGTEMHEEFSTRLSDKITECRNMTSHPGDLNVCLDLNNVSFIASSFIRTCMITAKQLRAGNFRIINASPDIKKTFKIAGLDVVLNVS
jgi:anti-anti-sigma factor